MRFIGTFLLLISAIIGISQNALTAEVDYATYNYNCRNGSVNLHINVGYPPFEVTWRRYFYNHPFPHIFHRYEHNLDISALSNGIYFLQITDYANYMKIFKLIKT